MELKVTTLDGEKLRFGHGIRRDFRARAAHRHYSSLRRVAAGQAPARHPRGEEPRRYPPHRQEDVSAEGHRLAPATARRASICSAAAAVRSARIPRSHEIGLPKKVRALALKHALSAKAKDDGIIVIEALSVKEAKTKALRGQFAKLGLSNALFIDGAEVGAERAQRPRATFRISTCCRSSASTSTTSCGGRSWF